MVGVIGVASDTIETPQEVADTIGKALEFVPRDKLIPAPTVAWRRWSVALRGAKLNALAQGAQLLGRSTANE